MKTLERPTSAGLRTRFHGLRGTEPAYQAYAALRLGYTALPIVAGADKFSHYLVDWNQYLAPIVVRVLGGRIEPFMKTVGVIEIAAGVLVALSPRRGAPIVCLWLLGIICNLMLIPDYFDIALRDFGLALGAVSLWRLSAHYESRDASYRLQV